ncbi:MAG: DNA gyrase subunit A [Bacillota bacterium]|uniref:DNA gyrase subunit A n=1 Tax=Thermanaerosceptrum fracticalcis TaxID=1712410 RepID=A0A7G6E577_THEFR|nr:DNA gyrase subunit A [Thermanaerosceptrum fracticalcis]QNB47231.1 DNA gyrase subunit A [Thermanaerosceptrum fracticalcis]
MEVYTDGKIVPIRLEEEMKKSYIDYAMSVIIGRALPDVRDGLKPVHRRILYAMHESGMSHDKPHKKSARVVGDVLGRYHPHGDTAVYDAMVRLAQDFSTRYPLIDGHGNFGSIDGDSAAAMRYTEVRMAKIAMELLRDIEKETVNFVPNYDDSLEEPAVLPSRFPNLLVNGSSGIAVGMATNIPPHNLVEVINGVVALIDKPDITPKELMSTVKGPDFPTGGIIMGRDGIKQAYETGRGSIKVRGVSRIEKMNNGKMRILITELPYLVNKARLIEKIAELVRDKKIDGITDLRDESDRTGMRIVIELRRDVNPQIILNQLYKQTQLEDNFGVIMLALVDGEPRVLNLKEMLFYYLEHQKDVIVRRTRYDLRKAEERLHIVEGLKIALDHIDEVVRIIRQSRDEQKAKINLMERFGLSEKQAQAIVDMRLGKLSGLEREKLEEEYRELIKKIAYLRSILADEKMVLKVIKEEITVIRDKYGDERRTQISAHEENLEVEDLIAEEDVVIAITHGGYIKRQPITVYRNQKRGGRGISAITTKEEDFVEHLFITTTHHYLLFFTNKGKVYRLKVYEIPEASRQAKGTAIVNLLFISGDEKITAVIPVRDFSEGQYLVTATRQGIVKKTSLTEYDSSRKDGIIALTLDENDELIGVKLTNGRDEIILSTRQGMVIRFAEDDVRSMGRTARGVKGITLESGDVVVGMETFRDGGELLVITEQGFGKKTPLTEFRIQSRGGKGIIGIKVTSRNGQVAGIMISSEGDEIMLITLDGIMIRVSVDEISTMGRATQGVKIMRLGENDKVVALARIAGKDEE